MSEFKELLKEIRRTLRKLLMFDLFIETLLVFLGLYLIFFIFNFPKTLAIVFSLIYFIIMFVRRRKLTSIRTVEQKYPILNEALRTVNDTLTEDNYLVNHLRDEVKQKVRKVSASSFMDIKGDMFKIALSIGLVFLILSLSICKGTSSVCNTVFEVTDIPAQVKKIDISDIYNAIAKESLSDLDLSANSNFNVDTNQILLNDQSNVVLGNDKVKIQIKLSSDQIDIHDVSDDVERKEFMDMDITDISARNDVTFEEDISKEHKELVKNYFNTINR